MWFAATFTYIPRNYNYFSVKKCQTPVLVIMILENAREYKIITYIYMSTQGRRKREHYPTTILIRAYTYIISLSFCSRLFCHISFIFKISGKLLLLHALRILNTQVMCDVCECMYIITYIIYGYLLGLYLCYATVLPLKLIACPFYRRVTRCTLYHSVFSLRQRATSSVNTHYNIRHVNKWVIRQPATT